jgi:DNA-binding response OmpR family regulator
MTFDSPAGPASPRASGGSAPTQDRTPKGAALSAAGDLYVRTGYADSVRREFADDRYSVVSRSAPVSQPQAVAPGRTILVAQDDIGCRTALHQYLESSGYRVVESEDVLSSLRTVFGRTANLVILDLERDNGTSEVLTRVRRRSTVPIIVTAARASERDRVHLLNLGADDIVAKPYSLTELEARVRAVLRRGSAVQTTTLHVGALVIDPNTRTVTLRDDEITLTRKEFDLLAFLASSPGHVFSREELLEQVWGSTSRWQGRSTVTEHIRRIRLKIEADPERPKWIITVRGVGYRFSPVAG